MTSREKRDVWISLFAVIASGATVVTCSAIGPRGRGDAAVPPVASAAPSESAPPAPVASLPPSAPVRPSAAPDESSHHAEPAPAGQNALPRVPRFLQALSALSAKARDRHVRVLWLGDSHTQYDGWTNALRVVLQTRFGKGGPGFVHIGWSEKKYRHRGVTIRVEGRWRTEPQNLISIRKVDDGVFGLGGVRLVPVEGSPRASLEVDAAGVPGKVRWDLAYRIKDPGDSLVVSASGHKPVTLSQGDAGAISIRHFTLESPGPGGTIEASPAGSPELFGVAIESSEPGVVVDTLGLNGARISTALALEEAAWVQEASRRQADLVIVAYGSNESSDGKIDEMKHAALMEQLIGRVRAAAPAADCLVLGPIDRGGKRYEEAVEQLNAAQRVAASKAGCAFWSGQLMMGGKGSMTKWEAEDPPLAQADLLHLTAKGYDKVGNALAQDLLRAFDGR
jgi:lysophospholipase L1-like esterase